MTIVRSRPRTRLARRRTPYGDFAHIPAGSFIYGPEVCYERQQGSRALEPQQTLELEDFWLAIEPVTYARWRHFLGDSGYDWQGRWYRIVGGWRGLFLRAYAPTGRYPQGHDDLPIVDVSQADAYAYCRWLSAKIDAPCTLPTEQQWEKAARGPHGLTYPWGETPPRPEIQWQEPFPVGLDTYVYSLFVKPRREWARAGWYWRNGYPLPIGTRPQNVSEYGCVDMSGNIWEWTSSLYNPDLPEFHVVKGGSWGYSIHHVKSFVRSACSIFIPSVEYRAQGTGFRVAIDEGGI